MSLLLLMKCDGCDESVCSPLGSGHFSSHDFLFRDVPACKMVRAISHKFLES